MFESEFRVRLLRSTPLNRTYIEDKLGEFFLTCAGRPESRAVVFAGGHYATRCCSEPQKVRETKFRVYDVTNEAT